MGNKKDILPIIIASIIALIITVLVRFFLPVVNAPTVQQSGKQTAEISMPKIPLMESNPNKQDVLVLCVKKEIKKDKKIQMQSLGWKKWPSTAVQQYFIAKTQEGSPLNNGADYSNSLKMWAKHDIPAGIPLTMQMLTTVDPAKAAAAEKKKAEEEERAAKEKEEAELKEKEKTVIRKGMRAVTLPVNQASAISATMLAVGDHIDILIMPKNGKPKKYTALKILAVDGDHAKARKKQNAIRGTITNFVAPKNITLEVKEHLVETVISQASGVGIIIALRNQDDDFSDHGGGTAESIAEQEHKKELLSHIFHMNKVDDLARMNQQQEQDKLVADRHAAALNDISKFNRADSVEMMRQQQSKEQADAENKKKLLETIVKINSQAQATPFPGYVNSKSGGKLEFVSGKTVGAEQEQETNTTKVYRQLRSETLEFDEQGNRTTGKGQAAAGVASKVIGQAVAQQMPNQALTSGLAKALGE